MRTPPQTDFASDAMAYRHAFRRYLRDLDDAAQWRWRAARFSDAEAVFQHDAERMLRLYADGWVRFGWPEWAGGFGGTDEHRMAYFDELARGRLPLPIQHQNIEQFLPPLIDYAPELAAIYGPRFLRGTEWWSTNASGWPADGDVSRLSISAVTGDRGELVLSGRHCWKYLGPKPTQVALVAKRQCATQGTDAVVVLVDADAFGSAIRSRTPTAGRPDVVEITVDTLKVLEERLFAEAGTARAVALRISSPPQGLGCYAALSRLFFDLGLLREAMTAQGSSQGQRQRFAQVYVDVVSAQALSSATIRAGGHIEHPSPGGAVEPRLLRRARARVSDLILDVGRARMVQGTTTGGESLHSARAEWWYSHVSLPVDAECARRDRLTPDRSRPSREAALGD